MSKIHSQCLKKNLRNRAFVLTNRIRVVCNV